MLELARSDIGDADLGQAYGALGQLYLAHKLDQPAEAAFANAQALAPGDHRWPYYLGYILRAGGRFEEARLQFERVLELQADALPALINLGNVVLELGDHQQALELFERVLAVAPDQAAAHFGIGRALAALDRVEEAVHHFEITLRLQPRASIVHYPLAVALRTLGRFEEARNHLEQRGQDQVGYDDILMQQVTLLETSTAVEVVVSMAADDSHTDSELLGFAIPNLGPSPHAPQQLRVALQELAEQADRLEPGSPEAARHRRTRARVHYVLAGLLNNRGKPAQATQELQAVLALDDRLDAYLMLGFIQERSDEAEAALASYARVLAGNPDHSDALAWQARVLMRLGRESEAIPGLQRLCELQPRIAEHRIRLGAAYAQTGQLEAAQHCYLQALELAPNLSEEVQIRHHLGKIASRNGAHEQAVEQYLTALELDPSFTPARLDLAAELGLLQRYEEALPHFQQVIEDTPDNVEARLGEATILSLLGRGRDARTRLEQGLQQVADNLPLAHALARLLAACPDRSVRDGEQAVRVASRVYGFSRSFEHAETLAMAYAEAGRFAEAVQLQQRLVHTAPDDIRPDLLETLKANLARYETGQPCCAAPE